MPNGHHVEVDEFIPHPIDAVWDALTDPRRLEAWFMPNDFEAEVGHRFTLDTGRWGVTSCEVTELDPPRTLTYAWRNGPLDTTVTWQLTVEGRGTRVLLLHAGFDLDDPAQRAAFEGMSGGWKSVVVANLVRHLGPRPVRHA